MVRQEVKMFAVGTAVTSALVPAFGCLYTATNGAAVGIIFGAVNSSVWEQAKLVLLSFTVWSLIEAIGKKKGFHRFAAARVISMWALIAVCIIVYLLILALDIQCVSAARFICGAVCCAGALAFSNRLEYGEYSIERLFLPCVFMLLLLVALYCSLTIFPPHMVVFKDMYTGLYGIIPEYIDSGAIALDTLYNIR